MSELQSSAQSLRRLAAGKKDLRSHLLSICVDAAILDEVYSFLEPHGLPRVANLRNGKWYGAHFDGDCYFKSTDGHHGQWNFSLSRLNLDMAKLAICRGGALIVDSTKQGKRFPDSFTATIPIWCAIINYVMLYRSENEYNNSTEKTEQNMNELLCTPEWINKSIRTRIVERCAAIALALPVSAVSLIRSSLMEEYKVDDKRFKPFRPLWVCPDEDGSIDWDGEGAEELLEAFSSSGDLLCYTCESSDANTSGNTSYVDTLDELNFIPLILLSVSGARNSVNYAPAASGIALVEDALGNITLDMHAEEEIEEEYGDDSARRNHKGGDYTHSSVHSWEYVPGAGDDEESWAKGLTAELFWRNVEQLLGESECRDDSKDEGLNANARVEYKVTELLRQQELKGDNGGGGETLEGTLQQVGKSHVYMHRGFDLNNLDNFSPNDGVIIVREGIRDGDEEEEGRKWPTGVLLISVSCDKQSKTQGSWPSALKKVRAFDASVREACTQAHSASGTSRGRVIVCAQNQKALASAVAVAVSLYSACAVDSSTTTKLQARTHVGVVHRALGHGGECHPPRWVLRELGMFLDATAAKEE